MLFFDTPATYEYKQRRKMMAQMACGTFSRIRRNLAKRWTAAYGNRKEECSPKAMQHANRPSQIDPKGLLVGVSCLYSSTRSSSRKATSAPSRR